MCKYCKRLEELKDLDKKYYEKLIGSWRRHVYKAEAIMHRAIDAIDNAIASDELCEEDICDLENSVSEMDAWIRIDYVGK